MVRISFLIVLLAGFAAEAQVTPYHYSIQKNVVGSKVAVVSAHTLASQAGLEILKQGGNAFDAAIATQLALAVVYPGAGNLGGGGFMVAHTADGKNIALDYRETAPSKASRDMYLDKAGNPITSLSMEGPLASGVPGTVAGLFAAMKYARLPFKTLIAPAIKLAEQGFVLTAWQAADFNGSRELFLKMNKHKTAFVKDLLWEEGDTLIQKDLANTLKRIRDNGAKGFYEGVTAKMIADEMKKGNGIISLNDLKNYEAKEREVMYFTYKGNEIITMPLPSSGGVILKQLLKMIEKRDIASLPFQSAESVQLMTEAERRAYADRAEFLGDPDFVKVPVNTLTSDAYLQERMKDFVPGKAGNSIATKFGIVHESEQTTHLSIVDQWGNAVSVTTTLNDHFGNKTVVTGAGFIMNNEMDDFSVKAGAPNMYGAVGNEKNAIAPGKRMLSSMTPTIVLQGGRPVIVVGTPGGTTIPTSVFQSLVNIIDYKMSPEDAVNKPKFHHQWLPDVIYVEKTFPTDVRAKLEAMGYKIIEKSSIGRVELIKIDVAERAKIIVKEKSGIVARTKEVLKITAVADKRGDDDARGF